MRRRRQGAERLKKACTLACSACTPCQNSISMPALRAAGVAAAGQWDAPRRWPRLAAGAAPQAPPPDLRSAARWRLQIVSLT